MKKILLIFSLILGLFSRPVLAQEEKLVWIDVISPYQNILVGQTLPIGIAITSADTHTSYKYFFYGGPPPADYTSVQTIGLDGTLINADNILLNIDNLPLFTTDGFGNGYLDTTDALIGSTQPSGRYYVYVGLFAPDNSTPPNLTSDPYQIYVLPNPNPEPTIEPTLVTPSPSFSPTPTQIPIPTPTLTSYPTPSLIPTNTITPAFVSQLSTPTKAPTPTIDPKKYSLLKPTQKFLITPTPNEIPISPESFLAIIQAGKNPLLDKPTASDNDNIFVKNFTVVKAIYLSLLFFVFLALLYFFYHQYLVSNSDSKKRKNKHLFIKKKFHVLIFFFISWLFLLNKSTVLAVTDTITTSQNWVVPSGVTSIIIEAWGGGGAGGSGGTKNKYGGGGGAGGQYVKKTISVSVGQSFSVVVGAGGAGVQNATSNPGEDSVFISLGTGTTHALAKGGLNGVWYDLGGAGGVGTTAGGIGDTIYKGGDGAAGSSSYSGGGGGGPGTTGAGGNASGMTAGVGTTAYGGTGGIGVNGASSAGTVGSIYASGGSGATKNGASGAGATGLILVTYTVFTNDPPSIPTLISPTDSSTGQSLTPTFQTVTTDTNNDNVQYELKICTDSGMTTNCQTFDQTSSNIGWSGQDIGTSAYSSGTTATYVLQIGNSLVENTTYYWKTRAIDYSGSNTWSSTQTTAYSFTTNSRPNTPTLVSPGTGSTQVSLTPELKTVTTDPNSDPLQYKIELCTNEAMSTSCNTYDLSSSITGWSGTDVGTSAYASGTTATYTVQVGSSLAASTTYYWRSYAKDPTGTDRWSTTQGTVFSFKTISPILNQVTYRWSDDDASGESRSEGVGGYLV